MTLFESDVMDSVCDYMTDQGFNIEQQLSASEHGDDIIATNGSLTFYIEAKGSTSSRSGSSRYGETFSRSQVRHHVAMALYKAAEVMTREGDGDGVRIGIALPENSSHVDLADGISKAIERLGLTLFWVDSDGEVRVEGNTSDLP